MNRKTLRAALEKTLPVLAGYVFLGIAFGFLMKTRGFPAWVPICMSVVIYSGALEFAAVPVLSGAFDPLGTFFMGLMISARHLFYGIPMLKKYQNAGWVKPFLIFALTDETFSVNSAGEVPAGADPKGFYTAVSLLDYAYWVGGTVLGACFGAFLSFDTTGIDFALTALFLVLFLENLKGKTGIISSLIGLGVSGAVLLLWGSENFVVLSMAGILLLLLSGKRVIG